MAHIDQWHLLRAQSFLLLCVSPPQVRKGGRGRERETQKEKKKKERETHKSKKCEEGLVYIKSEEGMVLF